MNQLIEDLRAARADAAKWWGQGTWVQSAKYDDRCQVCLVGACMSGLVGIDRAAWASSPVMPLFASDQRMLAMLFALEEALPPHTNNYSLLRWGKYEAAYSFLSDWSENYQREVEDVLELFDKAIATEEARVRSTALMVVPQPAPVEVIEVPEEELVCV